MLQDALFEKVVFSMNVYKYGRVKKLVYYTTTFGEAAGYIFGGERLLTPLSDFEAVVFCRLFPYNQRLEYLDLSANVIKDYGFMAIAEWLGTNSTLLFLNIANNDLDALKDKTLDLLVTTLGEHPNLRT